MIAFVRHGQTASNLAGVLLGRADPPLTDGGKRQAARLAERFALAPPRRVLASPLGRARDTAAVIARACGLDVVVDDRLVEIDYGDWDERPFSELPPEAVTAWRDDPGFTPPGGESLEDVLARVAELCVDLLTEAEPVVAVSHVSPIKAAVAWAIGADAGVSWRLRLDLASVSRVAGSHAAPILLSFNETDHLD